MKEAIEAKGAKEAKEAKGVSYARKSATATNSEKAIQFIDKIHNFPAFMRLYLA